MPRVSVVMAVRDGEDFLQEALDSVLAQTLADLEVVVVDDGSTDGTGAILDSYDDPRLRVLTRPAAGLASSLNAAIRASTAPLVARMDADDVSEPARLQRQAAFLDSHPDHVLVGSDVLVTAEDGAPVHTARLVTEDGDLQRCLDRLVCPFFHGAVMVRRDALEAAGLYEERAGRHVEDMLLWLRLRRLGRLASLPEPLYRYRFRAGSLSRLSPEAGRRKAEVIRRYAETLELAPEDERAVEGLSAASGRGRRAAYELDLGKLYLDRAGDAIAARRHLRRAVAAAPASPRAWFNLGLALAPRPVRDRRMAARNVRPELRELVG